MSWTGTTFYQALYNNILESVVDNPQYIPAYQGNHSIERTEYLPEFYEYVIITTDALKNHFNKFIEWKQRKGINIGVTTVQHILSHYSGDLISGIYDDAGKIGTFKRCLRRRNCLGLIGWRLYNRTYSVWLWPKL